MKADNEADAFVIGCYSGPGLHLCREVTDRSVFGIAECAITTALTRGGQFGVIAILANSVGRHMRHMQERLLHPRCAGDRPLGLSITDVEGGADTFERMARTRSSWAALAWRDTVSRWKRHSASR